MSSKYKIMDSVSGCLLCEIVVNDPTEIEYLSGDNSEGHFTAGNCEDIVNAGVNPLISVYALVG